MGMFDYINYKGHEYQTKDTPVQYMDRYKIEIDQDSGHEYLWHEARTIKMLEDENNLFGIRMESSNYRWECCHDFDGAIDFYRTEDKGDTWIEYHSLFMDGKLIKIEKVE